jgi:hypothetical protein
MSAQVINLFPAAKTAPKAAESLPAILRRIADDIERGRVVSATVVVTRADGRVERLGDVPAMSAKQGACPFPVRALSSVSPAPGGYVPANALAHNSLHLPSPS